MVQPRQKSIFRKFKQKAVRAAIVLYTFLYALPLHAQTDGFNYEYIISDNDLISFQTMSKDAIQLFLEHHNAYISNYFFIPDDSAERISAADHIYRTSLKHRINPRFLLALLQKEQGLIEEHAPKQTQLDWATGYGCFDNQPCNERWRGFHKQVNSAAEQFRYYFEHISEYPYRTGKPSSIDGKTIVPKNSATAALYNYTPHLSGNRLFRQLWEKYFAQRLPDGTLVQVAGEPTAWLIKDGQRYAFASSLALVSRYDPALAVPISASDLDKYTRGADIEFPAYSLLRGRDTGATYLLTADVKRRIESPEVFKNLGFNPEEVEMVDDAALQTIADGRPITISDAYPTGAVLQNKSNEEFFYVEAGRKYPIFGKELVAINFPGLPVTKIAADVIAKYSSGLPARIKDGTIVKGTDAAVYVISNGQKRHIASEDVFNAIGYKWSNIKAVSDALLELHQSGDPITLP